MASDEPAWIRAPTNPADPTNGHNSNAKPTSNAASQTRICTMSPTGSRAPIRRSWPSEGRNQSATKWKAHLTDATPAQPTAPTRSGERRACQRRSSPCTRPAGPRPPQRSRGGPHRDHPAKRCPEPEVSATDMILPIPHDRRDASRQSTDGRPVAHRADTEHRHLLIGR